MGNNPNVLVTGGAGFIGTHLTRRLLREGCTVTVLDNFSSQVHAGSEELDGEVVGHVRLLRGDVRDRTLVGRAVEGQDVVVHLAAETGTGQSMYEVRRYEDANIGGTATIIEELVNAKKKRVCRFVLASSRAVYGEGEYWCESDGTVFPGPRDPSRLLAGKFDPVCPVCGVECISQPTSEESPLRPLSFYGLTKQTQESLIFMFAQSCCVQAYALRYQNVYGPGQSLANPYTGILAIFSSLARRGSPIQVFEDGRESRDFIYIDDVIEATWRFISAARLPSGSYNVGTGERIDVLKAATEIVRFYGDRAPIRVTGAFREGDIRHNFANMSKTRAGIEFTPRFGFVDGLGVFLNWAEDQHKNGRGLNPNTFRASLREMTDRGLLHE